tara:strand:- start:38 stop:235 length:198 start_codon:yes stop_codon:yes gene_type:complete
MEKKEPSRRGFLRGAFLAAGATSATVLTAGAAVGKAGKIASDKSAGPVLYRRTEESERYYKTLYT